MYQVEERLRFRPVRPKAWIRICFPTTKCTERKCSRRSECETRAAEEQCCESFGRTWRGRRVSEWRGDAHLQSGTTTGRSILGIPCRRMGTESLTSDTLSTDQPHLVSVRIHYNPVSRRKILQGRTSGLPHLRMLATPLEHTSPHPSTCKSSGMGLSPASAGFGKSDAEKKADGRRSGKGRRRKRDWQQRQREVLSRPSRRWCTR